LLALAKTPKRKAITKSLQSVYFLSEIERYVKLVKAIGLKIERQDT
jgi:hypothetical protein